MCRFIQSSVAWNELCLRGFLNQRKTQWGFRPLSRTIRPEISQSKSSYWPLLFGESSNPEMVWGIIPNGTWSKSKNNNNRQKLKRFPLLCHGRFFFFFFEGHESFLWGHSYPCFGLLVTSSLGYKARVDPSLASFLTCAQQIPQIHLWCDTCRPHWRYWCRFVCWPVWFL